MKRRTKLFAGLLSFLVTVNYSYGQLIPGKAMLAIWGNGMLCYKTAPGGNYYSYPVIFNGHILDYADFKMKSRGQLSIVTDNPGSANATEVPFYIYLGRNGKIVKECKMNCLNQPVNSIEIADILSFSKAGDVLVIIPAAKPGGKTKIILNPGC